MADYCDIFRCQEYLPDNALYPSSKDALHKLNASDYQIFYPDFGVYLDPALHSSTALAVTPPPHLLQLINIQKETRSAYEKVRAFERSRSIKNAEKEETLGRDDEWDDLFKTRKRNQNEEKKSFWSLLPSLPRRKDTRKRSPRVSSPHQRPKLVEAFKSPAEGEERTCNANNMAVLKAKCEVNR